MVTCSMCDHVLKGHGTKMVHFAQDEEKIIEYYCSTICILAAYGVEGRYARRWWRK